MAKRVILKDKETKEVLYPRTVVASVEGLEEALKGNVQNLAGSASDEQTVVKAGNDSTNPASVTVTKNGASIHGRAGDVTIDDDGVNIAAGNSGFPNATVKVNGLPVATQQYVNNTAAALSNNIRLEDGEDLTVHVTDDGKKELKLADKSYAPAVFSGLGRKYLRKNYSVQDAVPFNGFVEGVTVETAGTVLTPTAIFFDTVNKWFVGQVGLKYYNAWQGNSDYEPVSETKTYVYNGKGYTWDGEELVEGEAVSNVLTQTMVSQANTIYVIQYDYDLNGETITLPTDCVLQFDGGIIKNGSIVFDNTYIKGNAQMADVTIDGTIANPVIESVWFGNTPTILSKLISIANASKSRLELTPRYDYVVNEQVVVTLNNNFELIGNGANVEIASTGFIQFKNPTYLQQAATTDIARGATSYTFTSIPSSIKEGDLFIIKSSLNGESAYNTKRQFISIVGKISGNTIYFTDAVTLDFPASSTTLYFAKKGTSVRLKDLNFICNRGGYYVNVECSNTSPIIEHCYLGGLNSSYGLHITDCVNASINGLKIGTLAYGVLVNNSAHVNISNVAENEVGVHPVAIASFSNFVNVSNVSGIGALVECHTGFNITYDNCHFVVTPSDSWNIRGAGLTLKNSSIHSSDGNPATNVLIGTMQLYDVTIYDDYMFKMFNCDLQMNALDISNSGIVDIDLCRFLPNAKIGMGRTNQARIKKGRIYRSENIEEIRIYNEFDNEFDTDMNNVDAVYDEDNNVYKLSQFTSSVKYVEKVGKTSTHGFLKPLSTGASLSLPIQLHSRFWQHNYVEFLVKVQAANRASSFTYAEKTFKVMICYTKVGNYSNIMEVTDLTPSENRITLQASNLSHANDTSQPSVNAGYLNFTLDIATTIASASAARMNVSYECNSDILNW